MIIPLVFGSGIAYRFVDANAYIGPRGAHRFTEICGEFVDALLFLRRGVLSSSCVAAAYDGNIVSARAALRRCNKRGDFLLKPDKQAAVQDCRGNRWRKESLSAIAFFLCTRYNKQKTQEELL